MLSPISVCVVIPMYNARGTISKALDSICNQTLVPKRIVVVDDGSQDNSAEIVEQYDAPCLLTLICQKNQGPAAARNRGIAESEEELICFLDADDAWDSRKIEKQVSLFQDLVSRGHNVGLIDCFEKVHHEDGKADLMRDRIKRGNHFLDFAKENVINGTSCVLVSRQVVNRFGGFDSDIRYAEDRWLWTQIAEKYELHTVPEFLSHRYIADTNITSNPSKYYKYKMIFLEKYMDKYSHLFDKKQMNNLVFISVYEFMHLFSIQGNHFFVIQSFKDMISQSWTAIFHRNGKALLRFLYSFTRHYLKV